MVPISFVLFVFVVSGRLVRSYGRAESLCCGPCDRARYDWREGLSPNGFTGEIDRYKM